MVKTLAQHGDSYALILDEEMLRKIQATPEMRFEVHSDGRSLVLTPVRESDASRKFDTAGQEVHERFGHAMKKLAE